MEEVWWSSTEGRSMLLDKDVRQMTITKMITGGERIHIVKYTHKQKFWTVC